MESSETLEGYAVDIACLRKYSASQLLKKAAEHSRSCLLMGHCVESGYGLVNGNTTHLLDAEATPEVVDAVSRSGKEQGIQLRVMRTLRDGKMHTQYVDEIE